MTRDLEQGYMQAGIEAAESRQSRQEAVVLRSRHSRFVYRTYDVSHSGNRLTLRFNFLTSPDIIFEPEIIIEGVTSDVMRTCPPEVLDNLAFHLGLMEIPSYWKATCSPQIAVEAGPIGREQLDWVKDLLIRGMGEFFFVNGIDFRSADFVRLHGSQAKALLALDSRTLPPDQTLVPMSGGKDSIVTWTTLSGHQSKLGVMVLNPNQAAERVIELSGCLQPIRVTRRIDSRLLKLNDLGYLNGHTPFSSYLAFLAVTCATLFGFGSVAMSNERSSNEGNRTYLGYSINHQYSKSFDFERKFRWYIDRYVTKSVEFFSFLRPLYEIQIMRQFAKATSYHSAFRSCNRAQAQGAWCESCPKCLSVYALLFPFVDSKTLHEIFSGDLFARSDLITLALDLLGDGRKPFECVGSLEESLVAFHLAVRKTRAAGLPLPPVLTVVEEKVLSMESGMDERATGVLSAWNPEHAVPEALIRLLRSEQV